MIAKIYSATPHGYNGQIIEVEGDSNRGLPTFNIVGMPNKTITEARERVRSAIVNSGFNFPTRKITINLAPADLAKDGSHLDLPIALAILRLSEQLLPEDVGNHVFVGELALDGKIRPVRGIINIIETAKIHGCAEVFLPYENLTEAALVPDIKLIGVRSLRELYLHLRGQHRLSPYVVKNTTTDTPIDEPPLLDDIYGQAFAKRALAIAIAGHHNLLLSGPPGTGKTMLAQVAAKLLPSPSPLEQLEIAKIHSLAGLSTADLRRPFRAPHHTSSPIAIIGGGPSTKPGEISLAHHGILFLDELPEFPRTVIESLRQPLEDHTITISRAKQHVTYPANFILIATMNPCPCGYANDPRHACTCTQTELNYYQKRISGPIRDRFDLTINVNAPPETELTKLPLAKNIVKNTKTDTTALSEHNVVKNTITEALKRQRSRYHNPQLYNGTLTSHDVQGYIHLAPPAQDLLKAAVGRLHLSTRSYFKIIKVARTIADLDASTEVEVEHISEALALRDPS